MYLKCATMNVHGVSTADFIIAFIKDFWWETVNFPLQEKWFFLNSVILPICLPSDKKLF